MTAILRALAVFWFIFAVVAFALLVDAWAVCAASDNALRSALSQCLRVAGLGIPLLSVTGGILCLAVARWLDQHDTVPDTRTDTNLPQRAQSQQSAQATGRAAGSGQGGTEDPARLTVPMRRGG